MLNLVQLQERLKDIPMQALMQYANGSNPQVPPFLALGELNRRKKMQEGAAADQAKEMEGAPTVKDQIEQASGLLALQGSRQRQAAQQQQGIQAAMPMAAPNTTTSEPAQMAEGGAVNDIVVPRDYQVGGQVSQMDPNMLRKLAMLKAMKQRQGISSIPVGDMFKRSDFAGGGIVAFQSGGQADPIGAAPWEMETDEERASRERAEKGGILGMIRRAIAGGGDPEFYSRDIRAQKEKERAQRMPEDVASGAYADRKLREAAVAAQQIPAAAQTRPSQDQGIASVAPARQETVPTAISRALGLKPEDVYPVEEPRRFEDIMSEERRREGLMGISDQFLKDRESRLATIQAQREKEREGQPMDRLMEMLSGIAEARGGNWATQGAAGAKRAMALEKEQRALRDKQDMEMDQLKFVVAEKQDALRRGDMTRYSALETKEKDLKRSMRESQAKITIDQAKIETDREQAKAQMKRAEADFINAGATRESTTFSRAITAANLEADRVRSSLDKKAQAYDSETIKKIKANPNYIDEQVEEARNRILKSFGFAGLPPMAGGATTGGSVEVKLPNGKTMYFPNQASADQFKKEAGIR